MSRRGMTLVEMLVALVATLIMMGAIAQVFSAFGAAIGSSRSVLDLDARMRTVAWRLRSDLAGVTARTLPPLSPDSGEGYFELIEGPATDADASAVAPAVGPADCDDVLLFTTRSNDLPFVGQSPSVSGSPNLFESNVAEVGWFARATPGTSNPQTFTLYRRQLLVMGNVGAYPFFTGGNALAWPGSWSAYFNLPCDVSVRRENNTLTPNTLSDLTRRENRFMHNPTGVTGVANYPFPFVNHQFASASGTAEMLSTTVVDGLLFDSTSQRRGEDIVLTNVIAFDVRVFDPAASVATGAGTPLVAGDPGFANSPIASGGYVDLGNGVSANSLLSWLNVYPHFSGTCQAASRLNTATPTLRVYDTWSTHYEANGLDEDGNGIVDDGTNGLDDNGNNRIDEPPYDFNSDGPEYDDNEDANSNGLLELGEDSNANNVLDRDNPGELETAPPYPWPLRGIEVRIRCYEPSSRQVRQITVRHSFVPL